MFGKKWTPSDDDGHDYDSYFDGPEAKLNREQYDAEQKALKLIDTFLSTLRPEDADRGLFTFYERKIYNIKHHRKYRG